MINVVSIVSGLLVLAITFRVFFDDFADFRECVVYWLTPDLISLFRGQGFEDFWAEMKLFLWFLLAVLAGYGVHQLLT